MPRSQERVDKQKKLSAAEIVKALEEHIDSIVTPEKAVSTEDELAAELTPNQSQIVLKLGPEGKRDKKIQIFASRLADGQVIYHVVDLRGVSREPLTPEDVAMPIEDPGLQHALKFSERLRTGESRVFSPEETKASWTESDRQIAELQSLVAEKFGGLKR
jgi:hypothetical protein